MASSPGQRNWRGIFIALLVIAAVLSLIVFSIFLLSPTDEGSRIKGQRLTLADVIGDALKPRPVNASWISGEWVTVAVVVVVIVADDLLSGVHHYEHWGMWSRAAIGWGERMVQGGTIQWGWVALDEHLSGERV